MIKYSFLVALWVSCFHSFGQQTILWRVTDTLSNKTSTLVGTFHQFGNSFVDSIAEIQENLYQSELAIFESIDTRENTNALINSRTQFFDIQRVLGKKDLNLLLELSRSWEVDIYKLAPIEVRWKLQQEFQKKVCETVKPTDTWDNFDRYLQHMAVENETSVLGLETFSLQLTFITAANNNPDWKAEKKNISYWIKQLTSDNPTMEHCGLAVQYRAFDLDYQLDQECADGILLKDRNENWMQVLPDLMHEKNCFVAVGYFHLRNTCGLIRQLQMNGFVVEPIELK